MGTSGQGTRKSFIHAGLRGALNSGSGFAGVFEVFDDQLQVLHAVEFVDG